LPRQHVFSPIFAKNRQNELAGAPSSKEASPPTLADHISNINAESGETESYNVLTSEVRTMLLAGRKCITKCLKRLALTA